MPTNTMPSLSIDAVRGRFPTLAGETAYLDNAGGSQVPACVADAMRDYMLTNYVQLGADYAVSRACSQVFADAHAFIRTFMGGDGLGEV
ncbi:MAG: cysteine desulfurase-like protein, partial [Phycisphaerales bacterium]